MQSKLPVQGSVMEEAGPWLVQKLHTNLVHCEGPWIRKVEIPPYCSVLSLSRITAIGGFQQRSHMPLFDSCKFHSCC